jgi:uncharacterized membrane protein YdjX (TVP38/TMEM64 family)
VKKVKFFKVLLWSILSILVVLLVLVGIKMYRKIGTDPNEWINYLRGFGRYSFFILLLFQILQVFIALIPGEVIEIVAGLLFNPVLACIICYVGIFIATAIVFFIIRKLGKRATRIFITEDKLSSLRFINTNEKLKRTVFFLYIIPGTPKDLFAYFYALTPIGFSEFFIISSIARFPTIISSVIGGKYISEGDYLKAIIVFIATAICSLVGILIFGCIKKKTKERM